MNYEIEELSQVEKRIVVLVPGLEVDIAIEAIIQKKRSTYQTKGFREGKVPNDVIFQDCKEEILSQAAQQIFAIRVKEAQTLYKVTPFNKIEIKSEAPLEKGKDFRFSFIVEVIPDLVIPEYKCTKVEVKAAVITEKDIDQIIDSLRDQLSTLEVIQHARNAADGDVVIIDFESQGEFQNVMGMSGINQKLELGNGHLIKDFETIIKSLKPGESGTGMIAYPVDYLNPALAGKSVKTLIKLKGLNKKVLPEIDGNLAYKIARVGSVTEMREVVRRRHLQRLTGQFEQDAKHHLLNNLMQLTNVPLAPTYVSRNLEEMIGYHTMAMQQQGITRTDINRQIDEKRQTLLLEAEEAAKRQLFLLAIAKEEQLTLEKEEVQREITRQAKTAETDETQFRLDAQHSGLMRNIKDDLMMRKVINMLYEKAEKTMVA